MNKAGPVLPRDLLDFLQNRLERNFPLYLVGGAVRDFLLGRESNDYDFVMGGNIRQIARRVADSFNGFFYMLDDDRNTARVILNRQDDLQWTLDFALFRGADLEEDIKNRDFTVNSIAIDISNPTKLIDPLGGVNDLREKKLRVCSTQSFTDDPVRVLRAIRLAVELKFRILPETIRLIPQGVPLLDRVSIERQRDELFKMLDNPNAVTALRLMEQFAIFPLLLPELIALKGLEQPIPHVLDGWEHTLASIQELSSLYEILVTENGLEASNLTMGSAVLKLGRYREKFKEHFSQSDNALRSRRSLLTFATLYHDTGKPITRELDAENRIRFFSHDEEGAKLASKRGRDLALSSSEIDYLSLVVRNHMRIHQLLVGNNGTISRRSIYRFFRATRSAGVDICLLSMADSLATWRTSLNQDRWLAELDVCRSLLEAWWEKPTESVVPLKVINGNQLQERYNLESSPLIGEMLEVVREAQATGIINNKEEALSLLDGWLENRRRMDGR